jgi:positive regulator of sigma E activity
MFTQGWLKENLIKPCSSCKARSGCLLKKAKEVKDEKTHFTFSGGDTLIVKLCSPGEFIRRREREIPEF